MPNIDFSHIPPHKKFVFICGLHRSGTSLLFKLLRDHPDVSGFANTGVPEDEGQHLQSVFPTARHFGGPARFAFKAGAYMDETSPLVTQANAEKLWAEWEPYWDIEKSVFIEKSPPSLVRTPFFQAIFPNSYFIILTRHPLALTVAEQRHTPFPLFVLLKHWFLAHQVYLEQHAAKLERVTTIQYEDLVAQPQATLDEVYKFLELPSGPVAQEIRSNINDKYLKWWRYRPAFFRRWMTKPYHEIAEKFGYDLDI